MGKVSNENCVFSAFGVNFGSFLGRRKTMKMKKMSVMLIAGLLMFCVGTSFAAWAYQWEANEYPENFQSGSVFSYYQWHTSNRSIVNDGGNNIYVVDDTEPDPSNPTVKANAKFWTKDGIWSASANGTIQFKLKIDSTSGTRGTLRFMVISDVAKNSSSNKCSTFLFYTDKISGAGFSSDYNLDTTVWRTYKTEYDASTKHTALYYDNGGTWTLIGDSDNSDYEYITYPSFKFGQGSSSISGKYEMDYIYWTPEPATVGLLGLGALGFIRRR